MDPNEIYNFMEPIPMETFKKFGRRKLQLTEGDIEQAEHQDPKAIHEQKYNLIMTWKMKVGSRQAIFKNLEQLWVEFTRQTETKEPIQNAHTLPSGDDESLSHSSEYSAGTQSEETSLLSSASPNASVTNKVSTQLHDSQHSSVKQPSTNTGNLANNGQYQENNMAGQETQQIRASAGIVQEKDLNEAKAINEMDKHGLLQQPDEYSNSEENPSKRALEIEKLRVKKPFPIPYSIQQGTIKEQSSVACCSENTFSHEPGSRKTFSESPEMIDLCADISKVEVDSCPTEQTSRLSENENVYPILNKTRKGYILIFNNTFKNVKGFNERKGSTMDVKNLKKLWKKMKGCKVLEFSDRGGDEIKNEIRKFVTSTKRADCGFVAFFIMSHGNSEKYIRDGQKRLGEDYFYGNDCKKVMISDVLAMLKNGYAGTTLKEIPKLLFLQMCRGDVVDSGVYTLTTKSKMETDNCRADNSKQLPSASDLLIGYATQPGYASLRDTYSGSWYINAIVNTFGKYAVNHSVLQMLTIVNNAVQQRYDELEGGKTCMQMSQLTSCLSRDLYLFPGQENDEY